MAKILLDYAFPVSIIDSLPAAGTGWLKKILVVVKPNVANSGNAGQVFNCTSAAQVKALTDNVECEQLFNAGISSVFILLSNDLDIAEALNSKLGEHFTLLVSSDFTDADLVTLAAPKVDEVKAELVTQGLTLTSTLTGVLGNAQTFQIVDGTLDSVVAGAEEVTYLDGALVVKIEVGVSTVDQVKTAIEAAELPFVIAIDAEVTGDDAEVMAIALALAGGANEIPAVEEIQKLDVGQFRGVVGIQSNNMAVIANQSARRNTAAFYANLTNKAKNMFFAFGKLLSNQLNWLNQQYITMPFNDGIDSLGLANELFDAKASFVLNDDEYGNVLGLFCCQKKAIVAPYIIENLKINLQSRAIQWISANQPQYTIQNAKLLEMKLKEDVIENFIARQWIENGVVEIKLENDNFVASGYINVTEPKALWRVFSELRQSL